VAEWIAYRFLNLQSTGSKFESWRASLDVLGNNFEKKLFTRI